MSNTPPARIRVYVREANRMATELLRQSLLRDRNFEVAGCGDALLEVAAARPDVAIISATIEQDPLKGCKFVAELRQACPTVRSVLLVDSPSRELILDACRAGARGIFDRNDAGNLRKCILAVYSGQIWMGQPFVELLVSAISTPVPIQLHNVNGDALLSKREQDIVRWVAEGMTNREIAEQSGLSEHTVKNYLFRIFDKLGVSTRVELVLYSMAQWSDGGAAARSGNGHNDSAVSPWLNLPEKIPSAAYAVAELFRRGYGVERDPRSAYKWLSIAEAIAERPSAESRTVRQQLSKELSSKDVADAERSAADWLRLHWPDVEGSQSVA